MLHLNETKGSEYKTMKQQPCISPLFTNWMIIKSIYNFKTATKMAMYR